jgi:hypothetical protein
MPEHPTEPVTQHTPEPELYGDPSPPDDPTPPPVRLRERRRPSAFGRLVSLIVSVGLAWALVVAMTAWLLGLFLTRG